MTPFEAFSTARGYSQSAFALMIGDARRTLPNDTTFFLSFHMLAGFAVELYLKAYLLHSGVSAEDLRKKKYGHDLDALAAEAKARGVPTQSYQPLITLLATKHKSFEYRYMKTGENYPAMRLDSFFQRLNDLDVTVDTVIGARASKGLQPANGWVFPSAHADWRLK